MLDKSAFYIRQFAGVGGESVACAAAGGTGHTLTTKSESPQATRSPEELQAYDMIETEN